MAIEKANKEVKQKDRLKEKEIQSIIKYIEDLGKKRILVEDIQDAIEQKIMEFRKYELAKRYIVYRYTRALVRRKNTTDESILGLIKTTNKEFIQANPTNKPITAAKQRDLIAGEVSKDLTNRMLLPEKITKAHNEGIIYFHNPEYFLQPMFNSCLVNIKDMLKNGTVINGFLIDTPKDFKTACIVITQIILQIASNQYGEQSIDINCLGEFLNKTYNNLNEQFINDEYIKTGEENLITEKRLKEELSSGIEIIYQQLNTIMSTNGHTPKVTIVLNIDKKDEYYKENIMIIEEILKQKYYGMKNENGEYVSPDVPKLVYVLNENNLLDKEYENLTKLSIKFSEKTFYPEYISAKKVKNNNYSFNQGVVSINLPQIAIMANKEEDKFWNLLDERLELCYEALMCRHYSLLGTTSDISPIHWRYGAVSRLNSGEKIDKLLKSAYSTISLEYEGLCEATQIMKSISYITKQGNEFAVKVLKHIKNTLEKWKQESNINFILSGLDNTNASYELVKIDKEKNVQIKEIKNKEYYTNSIKVKCSEDLDILEILKYESKFQNISTGEYISYVDIYYIKNNKQEKIKELIDYIYNHALYVAFKEIN